jgi:hypothetical protein
MTKVEEGAIASRRGIRKSMMMHVTHKPARFCIPAPLVGSQQHRGFFFFPFLLADGEEVAECRACDKLGP